MNTHETPSKRRAADRLIAEIEHQILDGRLQAGQPLPPEREIVEGHGVSRTVVREALRVLSSKGLIVTRPGFRPIVAKPGYDAAVGAVGSVVTQLLGQPGGVRNLFELRIRMEASLVREAALSATAQNIDALERALAENKATIMDSSAFYQTDTAFHAVLYAIPGNPVLPAIHRAYTDWLSSYWSQMPRRPEVNQTNFEAHQAIFDAVLRRNPDAAELALRDHLDFAWRQVSAAIEGL